MNAATVLVDGAWRKCIWIYPARRLGWGHAKPWEGDADELSPCATAAVVGGVPLLEGSRYRYMVASAGLLYTVSVDMAFENGNNLCRVLSVLANDAYGDPAPDTPSQPDFWCFRR